MKSACRRARDVLTASTEVPEVVDSGTPEPAPVATPSIPDIPGHGASEAAEQFPRIAMLVESLLDGGLEKVVIDVSGQFLKQGIACPILVAGSTGRAAHLAKSAGCDVRAFEGDLSRLASAVREDACEILLVHHCYGPVEPLSRQGVKLVEVIHNAYSWQRDQPHIAELRRKHISRFVAVSDFVRDYSLSALSIAGRIRVIENGLSRHGLIRPSLDKLCLHRKATLDRPLLVHLANAHPQKNHVAILRAFEDILDEYPGARLEMAGVIDDETVVGRRVRSEIEQRGLNGHVRCAGALGPREVSRLLADAHVGLLPSAFEGFSIASLEYAYFGLPTILSDTGAARRLSDRYGHVVIADAVCHSPRGAGTGASRTSGTRSGTVHDRRNRRGHTQGSRHLRPAAGQGP